MNTSQPLHRTGEDPQAAANRHSCFLALVIYVALSFVYTLVLQTRLGGVAIPLALVLAVFGTLFVASAISALAWPDEVRWLGAALRGEWPDDGSLGAVFGRLEGDARPAPISAEPALAWSVEVSTRQLSQVQNRTHKILKVRGMGRVPMTVVGAGGPNGPNRHVRLVGLLDFDGVAPRTWKARKVLSLAQTLRSRGNARAFAPTLAGPGAALDDFATLDQDYDEVRFNPSTHVASDDRVEERVLRPGQEVCAFGVFDRASGSLRGRQVLGVERIEVLPGGPRSVAARLMRRTWLGVAAMGGLVLLSHGLIGALVFLGD